MAESEKVITKPVSDSDEKLNATPSNTKRPFYARVTSGTTEASMVKRPADYTWDAFTAGTAIGGAGHIKVYDTATSKFGRIPLLHSIHDD